MMDKVKPLVIHIVTEKRGYTNYQQQPSDTVPSDHNFVRKFFTKTFLLRENEYAINHYEYYSE